MHGIITIIVLLILAGISIAMIRNTNLIDNAKLAKGKYENSENDEMSILNNYEKDISLATTREDTITISKSEYEQMQSEIENLKTEESSITLLNPNDWNVNFNKVIRNGKQCTIMFGGTYKDNFNNKSVKIGTLPFKSKIVITDSGAVSTVDVHQIKNMLYVYIGTSDNGVIHVADWGATGGKTIVINTTYICD